MSYQAQRYTARRNKVPRHRRRQQRRQAAFVCRQSQASRRQPPTPDVENLALALVGIGIKCDYETLRWSVLLPNGRVTGFQVDLVLPNLGLVIEITGRNRMAKKRAKVTSFNAQNSEYKAVLMRSDEALELAGDHERLLDRLYEFTHQEHWGELHNAYDRLPVAA